jgi:hypothetical protein
VAPDAVVRRALWASVVFNVFGALMFAFPDTLPGRMAGLPPDVPVLYRALLVLFVLLFAGAYAWLARAPHIDRPLLALGAIGKAAAFGTVALVWLAGAVPGRSLVPMGGDLGFAALFAWWLMLDARRSA